jgi:uncharacterized protein with ParB-like and HNH nuclease domain
MFVALQGSYSYRSKYKRKNDNESFPKRYFYLNLQSNLIELEDEILYEFAFLTNEESTKFDAKHIWFKVSDVLLWKTDPEIDDYYEELIQSNIEENIKSAIELNKKEIKKTIRILHQRIFIEKLINYFSVTGNEIDEILNIFVRVNSSGVQLSRTDLLFSTIVASWQEAREEVEMLLKTLNEKGGGFSFDTDFVMKAALYLLDLPVFLKVKQFNSNNVALIKSNWIIIKEALIETLDLIVDFGFNKENLVSMNSILPIAYFIYNDGNINDSRKELKKYVVNSNVLQVFSSKTDRTLTVFRIAMKNIITNDSNIFNLSKFDMYSKKENPLNNLLVTE